MSRTTPKLARLLAALAAMSLVAAACGGGEDEPGGAASPGAEGTEAAGGEYSVYICEPEHLIPTNTNETCGSEVLNALFSGLVEFDPETTEPLWGDEEPDAVADDITTEDQKTWTITLKDGFTFHNGEPVTAQSFVDAWNFGAFGPNAQGNNYFFDKILGYEELNPTEEGVTPTATELSGLRVVDDQTIEVELNAPFSQFPMTLGYTAFYPLPSVAFDDIEAFEQAPIGNGPFEMDGEWEHDVQIRVTRFEDYGATQANAEAVTFKIYADINTAYNDLLAGNLDILEDVPPERVEEARSQLGDRYFESPTSSFTYIGFPFYVSPFGDNVDLRRAMSMAIDRQAIIDAGLRPGDEPADAFVNPVVLGYREGACGDNCTFDPEAAKQLFDEAGGIDGPLTVWFNSGAGHEGWVEAVANQWRQNLGIEEIRFESLQFAEYLELLDNEQITGPFRLGWVMDYPSMQNYLEPIHATNGSSNNTSYSNEQFDQLIAQGNQAETVDQAVEFYQQAEDILVEDMPIIPMFFGVIQGAHSERVSNVLVDPFDHLNVAEVTVTEG